MIPRITVRDIADVDFLIEALRVYTEHRCSMVQTGWDNSLNACNELINDTQRACELIEALAQEGAEDGTTEDSNSQGSSTTTNA